MRQDQGILANFVARRGHQWSNQLKSTKLKFTHSSQSVCNDVSLLDFSIFSSSSILMINVGSMVQNDQNVQNVQTVVSYVPRRKMMEVMSEEESPTQFLKIQNI